MFDLVERAVTSRDSISLADRTHQWWDVFLSQTYRFFSALKAGHPIYQELFYSKCLLRASCQCLFAMQTLSFDSRMAFSASQVSVTDQEDVIYPSAQMATRHHAKNRLKRLGFPEETWLYRARLECEITAVPTGER